jgi:hypothetical protein
MNRMRLFPALLLALFISAVGIGVVVGEEDEPDGQVTAAVVDEAPSTTVTTIARTTTTTSTSTTSTTVPRTTTTTVRRTTTTTQAPPTTEPAPETTLPPVTEPPTTQATVPTTTPLRYNPFECARVNNEYRDDYDNPGRIADLVLLNCPPLYYE